MVAEYLTQLVNAVIVIKDSWVVFTHIAIEINLYGTYLAAQVIQTAFAIVVDASKEKLSQFNVI